MDVKQFRVEIVRPVLRSLGLGSLAAENLLLGTAAQESRFRYVRQIGGGPALGIYQMEPDTHDDIWVNYLQYRSTLSSAVRNFLAPVAATNQLVWNLAYATAMCRVHYRRVPEPLPDGDDVEALARYWKRYYNTKAGAGTVNEFVENYHEGVSS